jgi:hypothetical protein
VAEALRQQPLLPGEAWSLLAEGLMAPHPGHFLQALREGGVLPHWLPEVAALFGVPQLCDLPTPVDVGEHLLACWRRPPAPTPLPVRLAALTHALGKAGTPREIWPSHYKHEQRAHAIADDLAVRFAWPVATLALSRIAIDELERCTGPATCGPGRSPPAGAAGRTGPARALRAPAAAVHLRFRGLPRPPAGGLPRRACAGRWPPAGHGGRRVWTRRRAAAPRPGRAQRVAWPGHAASAP